MRTFCVLSAVGILQTGCTSTMNMSTSDGGGMDMSNPDGGNMDGMNMNIPAAKPMLVPLPRSGELTLPRAQDENPDPNIVEVSLVAAVTQVEYLPGKKSMAWAYNGMVPGPTIRANVGDKVIVHFTNNLPEATSIHWHGVRVPNDMDGTQNVREPVPAGGSFDYTFTVPDAGNFWYHPHVRSDVQVHRGLYGAFIVEDPTAVKISSSSDEIVILNDVQIDPSTGTLDDTEDARAQMMGREGNLALVNGMASNLGVSVRAGEVQRLRIVNAANARYFQLALNQGFMLRLGGETLRGAPEQTSNVLLAPGMRADLLVWVPAPDSTVTMLATAYRRAMGAEPTETIDLVRFVASSEPAATMPTVPDQLRDIEELGQPVAIKEFRLSESMAMGGNQQFLINGRAYPDVPIVTSALGAVEQWKVINESDMDHPFHLHGFSFQVAGQREWKDTINIPPKADATILVDFGEREGGATGRWLYHCHILEHAERGMMGEVAVQ